LKNPNDIQIAKRHLETQMILKYLNDIELTNEKKVNVVESNVCCI